MDDDRETRLARLRDPRTYTTVTEWYEAYRGFVPIQMARALSNLMLARGITFAEAYDHLVKVGTIIEIGDVPPRRSATRDSPPAGAGSAGTVVKDVKLRRIVRLAVAWTVVMVVIAVGIAAFAAVRLYQGEQACFFTFPTTPCPDGPDLLPMAIFVIPGIWLLGLLILGLVAIAIGRRPLRRQ